VENPVKRWKSETLVGHGVDHDLDCLALEYPAIMIRYGLYYTGALKHKTVQYTLEVQV